jgi:5-hydroxyisourate hydrolase-like protein (transthyretin family)
LICIAAADDLTMPDLSKGQINGKAAMMALPVSGVERATTGGARFEKFLSPEGCQAHLAPFGDLEHELVYSCGTWFLPPEGRYRVWLEQPGLISEGTGLLTWDDEPFRGHGLAMSMGMEPAGRVALGKAVLLSQTDSFRIVHLRGVYKGVLRHAFDRRATPQLARTGVPIAAGLVLSGIFDQRTGEAIALARPVNVEAGKTTDVSPRPPVKGSDVFVVLARPRDAELGKDEVTLALDVDGHIRKPDVLLSVVERVIAVWYGIEARNASLHAQSSTLRLDPTPLALRPGKVITFRGKLALVPSISMSIHGPEGALRGLTISAELCRQGLPEPLQTIAIVPNHDYWFHSVPAEVLKVVLRVGEWDIERIVDLTSGNDEAVAFDLDPIVVSGTVFLGRDPAAGAEVAFKGDREWVRTKAGEVGQYELTLWRAVDTIAEVMVHQRDGPPFIDGPYEVKESRTIDFHVPTTRFLVDVHDAVSGEPVAGAKVLAGSMYSTERGAHNVLQTAVTDEHGRATLPPLRVGIMVLHAEADGYFVSQLTQHAVDHIDDEGHYAIALHRVGDVVEVNVQRGDRQPVRNATVWAVRSASGQEPPLWQGVADENGRIEVPRDLQDALFLIRADGAASAVRRIADTWTLTTPVPLTLKADRRTRLALWIDGVRISGVPLAFVTGSVEATDSDGMWSAATLPGAPVRILAWHQAPIESGAYDAVAANVPYPWPAVVDVKPVD